MEATPKASRSMAMAMLVLLIVALVLEAVSLAMLGGLNLGQMTWVLGAILLIVMGMTVMAIVTVSVKLTNAQRHMVEDLCQCATCGASFKPAGAPAHKPPRPLAGPRERRLSAWTLLVGGVPLIVTAVVGLVVLMSGSSSAWVAGVPLAVLLVLGVAAALAGLRMRRAVAGAQTTPHPCSCRWCGAPRAR